MKRMIHLNYVLIILLALTAMGCASSNKSHHFKNVDISIQSRMTADIDVDMSRKITGNSSAEYLFGIRFKGDSIYADGYGGTDSIGAVKSAAAYNAIKGREGDVLVSPQYMVSIERKLFYKKITVDVTGYEGRFKAIERIEVVN